MIMCASWIPTGNPSPEGNSRQHVLTCRVGGAYGGRVTTLDDIAEAVAAVRDAQTALDELAALHALDRLVVAARDAAVIAALPHHSAAEIGQALGGVSKQAINRKYGSAAKRGTGRRHPA